MGRSLERKVLVSEQNSFLQALVFAGEQQAEEKVHGAGGWIRNL